MEKSDFLSRIYKRLPTITFDILAVPLAWYMAYWLRYNMQPFPHTLISWYSLYALMILLVNQVACYYYFKVYRGLWHFSSLNDLTRILKSVFCAIFLTIPMLYLTSLLHEIPRSVLPLYGLILVATLGGARLGMRTLGDRRKARSGDITIQNVLIVGAGQAGESLVRDLKRTISYLPVGFVDDNPGKRGKEIHGVRVLGATRELPDLVLSHHIDLVFIAIPSARSATMRRIVEYCEQANVPFRTLPSIAALASGRIEMNSLREVNIEDLLGRDQVQLDWDKITADIRGKRVIVTGGGGSIGAELCRQILALKPEKLMIIDSSEFNLYRIENELKNVLHDVALEFLLMSVTDKIAVDYQFSHFKPQLVFHAAAYKHVPILEQQIRAAILNNVLGTHIVAEASVHAAVDKFILISSDKAVNPSNIMGMTKRVAEIYCQNLNERVNTRFITVRFGNVLGSSGSVVPLFQSQLKNGGPLTVTHPDIERYFMTIPEACQLILQAMVNGIGGEIFVLDMGEPIKISYLAEQMIRLAGKEPGRDVEIIYTGLRAGEKLYEELFHESEELAQTAHEKLFKAKFRKLDWQELTQTMRLITTACQQNNIEELQVLTMSLVPEFKIRDLPLIS